MDEMYDFFYDIACYVSDEWRGKFNDRELANYAYVYTCDCKESAAKHHLVGSMVDLIQGLKDDMYEGSKEAGELYREVIRWLGF